MKKIWSIEKLHEVAANYTDRSVFKRDNHKAYDAARSYGVLDEVCAHMTITRPNRMTTEWYKSVLPSNLEVLEPVNNATTKVLHRCLDCSHEWSVQPNTIRTGKGCPACAWEAGKKKLSIAMRQTHEQYVAVAARFEVLEEMTDATVPILHRCRDCQHEWKVRPITVRAGSGCPRRCTTAQDHIDEIDRLFGGKITLLKWDSNSTRRASYRCDKGHEFTIFPKDLIRMRGCRRCNCNGTSRDENAIYEMIAGLGFQVELNTRRIISPKELDIYVPSRQLAIEFNGSYWHATKDRDYHLQKTISCEESGVRLIHVWDHESDNAVMSSIIHASLGSFRDTIHGRKCYVQQIDWQSASVFLNENHIQGAGAATPINLGLIYNNEIVGVMTFGKPRFERDHDFELIRYAIRTHTRVNGGASKLWKRRPVGSIVTYSDRRLFDGSLYARLGFKMVRQSDPSYFHTNQKGEVLSRFKTRRDRLPALLGDKFDPAKSEVENMARAGYLRLWDCGTVTWSHR